MENKDHDQMLKMLDQILLSSSFDPVESFYMMYNQNFYFRKWINDTLPEIALCEAQQQNNPWHKYNVLGHILHSVKNMNQLTRNLPDDQRRMLAYTMFFHDIGKPYCHIKRTKNGRVIDSFFGHNEKSAEIAKEKLPLFGFNQKEVDIMTKLVLKHDIFMFIKPYPVQNKHWEELTLKVMKKHIKDLSEVGNGLKLMDMLIKVGRADSLAQNAEKTTFDLHDKMQKMLDEIQFFESDSEFE